MYQEVETVSDGDFIYLLALHVSSLQTGTAKIHQDYVVSLVIDNLLDSTHYKLRDLENRLLLNTLHTIGSGYHSYSPHPVQEILSSS